MIGHVDSFRVGNRPPREKANPRYYGTLRRAIITTLATATNATLSTPVLAAYVASQSPLWDMATVRNIVAGIMWKLRRQGIVEQIGKSLDPEHTVQHSITPVAIWKWIGGDHERFLEPVRDNSRSDKNGQSHNGPNLPETQLEKSG